MWRKIPVNIDEEILKETGVPELFGEKGFSTMERIWARPTAEINGFGGGYQGQGTKTVIGREAMAKLTSVSSRTKTATRSSRWRRNICAKLPARGEARHGRWACRSLVSDRSAFEIW